MVGKSTDLPLPFGVLLSTALLHLGVNIGFLCITTAWPTMNIYTANLLAHVVQRMPINPYSPSGTRGISRQ